MIKRAVVGPSSCTIQNHSSQLQYTREMNENSFYLAQLTNGPKLAQVDSVSCIDI